MSTWRMRNGSSIAIKDMETSHIKNSINMLKRGCESKVSSHLYIWSKVHTSIPDINNIIIELVRLHEAKIESLEKELSLRNDDNSMHGGYPW